MIDDVDSVKALFTRSDGCFRFARWNRPLAPMIAGTDDRGVRLFEDQIGAVAAMAGIGVTDLDPDSAANFMVFFVGDWAELAEIPALADVIPEIAGLARRLEHENATHYRVFGFDTEGAIGICVTLIRYGPELMQVSAQTLALTQAFQGILLWAEGAFDDVTPTALEGEDRRCVIKPWFRRLLAAAYDPVIPPVAIDSSLALRLVARMGPSDAAESAEMAAEQIAEAVAAATGAAADKTAGAADGTGPAEHTGSGGDETAGGAQTSPDLEATLEELADLEAARNNVASEQVNPQEVIEEAEVVEVAVAEGSVAASAAPGELRDEDPESDARQAAAGKGRA